MNIRTSNPLHRFSLAVLLSSVILVTQITQSYAEDNAESSGSCVSTVNGEDTSEFDRPGATSTPTPNATPTSNPEQICQEHMKNNGGEGNWCEGSEDGKGFKYTDPDNVNETDATTGAALSFVALIATVLFAVLLPVTCIKGMAVPSVVLYFIAAIVYLVQEIVFFIQLSGKMESMKLQMKEFQRMKPGQNAQISETTAKLYNSQIEGVKKAKIGAMEIKLIMEKKLEVLKAAFGLYVAAVGIAAVETFLYFFPFTAGFAVPAFTATCNAALPSLKSYQNYAQNLPENFPPLKDILANFNHSSSPDLFSMVDKIWKAIEPLFFSTAEAFPSDVSKWLTPLGLAGAAAIVVIAAFKIKKGFATPLLALPATRIALFAIPTVLIGVVTFHLVPKVVEKLDNRVKSYCQLMALLKSLKSEKGIASDTRNNLNNAAPPQGPIPKAETPTADLLPTDVFGPKNNRSQVVLPKTDTQGFKDFGPYFNSPSADVELK